MRGQGWGRRLIQTGHLDVGADGFTVSQGNGDLHVVRVVERVALLGVGKSLAEVKTLDEVARLDVVVALGGFVDRLRLLGAVDERAVQLVQAVTARGHLGGGQGDVGHHLHLHADAGRDRAEGAREPEDREEQAAGEHGAAAGGPLGRGRGRRGRGQGRCWRSNWGGSRSIRHLVAMSTKMSMLGVW